MLTERLQALCNRQLAASPRATHIANELNGRHIDIVVKHTPWQLRVSFNAGQLQLSRKPGNEPADATISGSPLSLAALAGDGAEAVIRRGDVRIEGDAELAARVRELGTLLYPDLEEELSQVIGDAPASLLGSVARQGLSWLRSSLRTGTHNVAEYLAHERRDLVPRAEAAAFYNDVDQLREAADRLQARIDALPARKGTP